MPFSNEIVSLRMSRADNSRDVPPGHWKREEDNYLTQIGAMYYINKDPNAQVGYQMQQSRDGSGLIMSGDPSKDNYGEFYFPDRPGEIGLMKVGVNDDPTNYGHTITHELGHAGQYYRTGHIPKDKGKEEQRQRFTDFAMYPTGSRAGDDAFEWLWKTGLIKPEHLVPQSNKRK
jgi:hypothetical protein